jgi:hypothetical protein
VPSPRPMARCAREAERATVVTYSMLIIGYGKRLTLTGWGRLLGCTLVERRSVGAPDFLSLFSRSQILSNGDRTASSS